MAIDAASTQPGGYSFPSILTRSGAAPALTAASATCRGMRRCAAAASRGGGVPGGFFELRLGAL